MAGNCMKPGSFNAEVQFTLGGESRDNNFQSVILLVIFDGSWISLIENHDGLIATEKVNELLVAVEPLKLF
jgi:hypothetical protein